MVKFMQKYQQSHWADTAGTFFGPSGTFPNIVSAKKCIIFCGRHGVGNRKGLIYHRLIYCENMILFTCNRYMEALGLDKSQHGHRTLGWSPPQESNRCFMWILYSPLQVLQVAPRNPFPVAPLTSGAGLELAWSPLRPFPPTAVHPITQLPPSTHHWPLPQKRGIAFLLWDSWQSYQSCRRPKNGWPINNSFVIA